MNAELAEREAEGVLVDQVQEFLRQRLQSLQPDALLTQAWDQFYHIYNDVLRRFAANYRLSEARTEDLLQEVWVRVILRLPEFHWNANRAGLRTWLYLLVRNKAVDLIRADGRAPEERQTVSLPDELEPPDTSADPEAQWQKQWRRELVHSVLEDLRSQVSEVNYRLMHLRFIEGKEVAETAAALGLTSEQVWNRQHHLLRKVRAALAVYMGDSFSVD